MLVVSCLGPAVVPVPKYRNTGEDLGSGTSVAKQMRLQSDARCSTLALLECLVSASHNGLSSEDLQKVLDKRPGGNLDGDSDSDDRSQSRARLGFDRVLFCPISSCLSKASPEVSTGIRLLTKEVNYVNNVQGNRLSHPPIDHKLALHWQSWTIGTRTFRARPPSAFIFSCPVVQVAPNLF